VTDTLSPTRKFLAQIHLQMMLTGRKKGLFCVASPNFEENNQVAIIPVTYSESFMKPLLEKAMIFWRKSIFPLLKETSK